MSDRPLAADGLGRRRYLQATGAAALATAGLAGCVGTATGTLATRVTDQPADIADFESLVVTIEGIWLGPEGAESGADGGDQTGDADGAANSDDGGDQTDDSGDQTDDSGDQTDDSGDQTDDGDDESEPAGREYLEFDEPQEADLVRLQDGETRLIDERELSVGTYQFLQLDVSAVDGTLSGGDEATVDLPGNAPLTFNETFEVRENTQTTFTADFAPVRRGTGSYLLRPVPSGIEVSYDTESGDGDADGGDTDGNES
ncbi:DUF4382 domain-containing protein [Halorubrum sp. SD626R]|uniref:DUF4382 domain-containing protein n=1 Tax=Halorubrum sp. SD626R TaxID=1419722 RepID=UPI0010F6345B|nr:DUF4382 domain-containing protein [Halorubrum sp. SD626R]TKX77529.1 DUF4382 domain-containing protein [Halorubrum sp. SD626R]